MPSGWWSAFGTEFREAKRAKVGRPFVDRKAQRRRRSGK